MSLSDVKKVYDLVTSEGPAVKFGLRGDGRPEDCAFVTVWATMASLTPGASEQWRFRLSSNTPLSSVRGSLEDAVGHNVEQKFVLDEAGFRFARSDLNLPISTFSNQCKLRLDFTHAFASEAIKSKRHWWSPAPKE